MHWTVLSQVLRRGGTKNGRPVEPSSIDGRIQQLRDQAQDTEDKDGPLEVEMDEGHAGELPADDWKPPGEYGCFCCTQLENDLQEALSGPNSAWLDTDQMPKCSTVYPHPVRHEDALQRQKVIQKLEDSGLFHPYTE